MKFDLVINAPGLRCNFVISQVLDYLIVDAYVMIVMDANSIKLASPA